MESARCPICNQLFNRLERYEKSICSECVENAVDSKKNKVRFFNGMSGFGFESHHFDSNNKIKYIKQDPVCYINNKKCIASESRFGGIVVELQA